MYKLLATSALVAAGLWGTTEAAFAQAKVAPISVTVGGYHQQMFGYGRNKNNVAYSGNGLPAAAPNSPNRFTQYSDSEVWFGGRTTLANGITIGFEVQLEGNTSGDQIDESYLFVDGAFGRLVIGTENSADYLMNYSIPGVGKSWGALESAAFGVIIRPTQVTVLDTVQSGKGSGGGGTVLPNGGNDQQRVTYFTPRFFGFGAGLSYTPNVTTSGTVTSFEDVNGVTDKRTGRHNAFQGSVNFTNNFSGFQVNASVGMSYYPKLSNAVTAPGNNTIKDISAGLQLGFGGFLVGGGYRDLGIKGGAEDGYAWGIGATWTGGPFAIGANYLTSKVEGATGAGNAADDKFRQIQLSAAYTMGPGVDLIGSVGHLRYKDEGNSSTNNNSGLYAVAGFHLSF